VIAAAPDLLAELQYLVTLIDEGRDLNEYKPTLSITARGLIAKATVR
jgi:hypothetical protein